jgi:hypothetical protein
MIGVLAFFLVLACLVVGVWGLAKAAAGAVKRRRAWVVRGLALLCGAFGVGAYAWGAMLVGLTDAEASEGAGSSPAVVCQEANRGWLTGHRVGYLPLRFDCVLEDGTTFSAGVVSEWLTPAAFALTAVAGVGLSLTRNPRPADRPTSRQQG